ncbi:MAG: hypothetical protein PUD55_06230 [Firmicutes bacterium]|nr:hypothetical protein [Bacillota bacterium]
MLRFGAKKQSNLLLRLLTPVLTFIIGIAAFSYVSDNMAAGTVEKQQATLEDAVRSSAVYCYSIEGAYPDSVEYLEENYGLTYDKDTFFVGYRLQGGNIMPEVTVICLKEQE